MFSLPHYARHLVMHIKYTYTNIIIGIVIFFSIPMIIFAIKGLEYHTIFCISLSFLFSLFLLLKYCNKIDIKKECIVINNFFHIQKYYSLKDIHKIYIDKDPFFYHKTIMIKIIMQDNSSTIHLGCTLAKDINLLYLHLKKIDPTISIKRKLTQ